MAGIALNLIGHRFGRWSVMSRAPTLRKGATRWFCRCDCGEQRPVHAASLISGRSESCGCLHKEIVGNVARRHGEAGMKTGEYRSWAHMIQRCYNENNDRFRHYGGRGIAVCSRWRVAPGGFEAFLADMGRRLPGTDSIDRINNDGNYSCGKCDECLSKGWPANCRWANKIQQGNNQRRIDKPIEFRGEILTMKQWSRRLAIPYDVLKRRIFDWGVERAFTQSYEPRHYRRASKSETTSAL